MGYITRLRIKRNQQEMETSEEKADSQLNATDSAIEWMAFFFINADAIKAVVGEKRIDLNDVKKFAATEFNAAKNALEFAFKNKVDITKVKGTGAEGKVTEADVMNYQPTLEPATAEEE